MTDSSPSALQGLKILDFTQLLQGPYATQMLGDLGADVIKIEKSGSGDLFRKMTFFNEWVGGTESPCFLAWNRNKRSLAIDIKSKEGKEIILKLAKSADVIVENFRPGVMAKLGLGYEDIRAINPRIIYCSASGWGKDGPYVSRPGQDLLVQGLTGAAMTSGRKEDGPVPIGTSISDQLGALHIVYGVLAALYHREKTGRGQELQISLLASTIALQMQDFMTQLNLGKELQKPQSGIGHPGAAAPFGIYATKDGWLSIAMNPWDKLVQALDAPQLMEYNDPQVQFDRRDFLWGLIQEILRTKTTTEWLEIMLGLDLWVAEVKRQMDVPDDPQVRHAGLFTTVEHPKAGPIRMVNIPIVLSETPGAVRRPPPLSGQHGREILAELGYDEAAIARLLKQRVITIEEVANASAAAC